MKTRVIGLLLIAAATAGAAERRIAFWPDGVVQAIQNEVDGIATLESVRELGRFHRVHGSPGFAKAAEHVRSKASFARRATSQLVRWESRGGWTVHGEKLADREVPLAQVLDGLLPAGDAWVTFGRAYVDLLDILAAEARSSTRDAWTAKSERSQRASRLSGWHQVLAKRLAGTEAEDLIPGIARHPALT